MTLHHRRRRDMPGTAQTMTTSDGVTLAYDDEGGGRPVVLLDGYSGRRANWEFQRDALPKAGHRVIALDARGQSEIPSHGQTMARLGQDTRELLELLDLEDVALVGHSMGVSVALAMFTISGFDRIERFVASISHPRSSTTKNGVLGSSRSRGQMPMTESTSALSGVPPGWNRIYPRDARWPSRGRTSTTTRRESFQRIVMARQLMAGAVQ